MGLGGGVGIRGGIINQFTYEWFDLGYDSNLIGQTGKINDLVSKENISNGPSSSKVS